MTFPSGVGFQNTGVIVAEEIIVIGGPGNGVFMYSGNPTLGNLVGSVSGVNVTADKFGNTVLPGITSYDNTLHVAISLVGSQWKIYTSATAPPGPYAWNQVSDMAIQGGGFSFIPQTNATQLFQVGSIGAIMAACYFIATRTIFSNIAAVSHTAALVEIQGELAFYDPVSTVAVTLNPSSAGLSITGGVGIDVLTVSVGPLTISAGGLNVTGGATIDTLTVSGTTDLDGATYVKNQASAPGSFAGFSLLYSDQFTQLHTDRAFVTDVNIETKNLVAAPGAGGSGAKTWSKSGHQQIQSGQTGIGGDTNVYDSEKLNQITSGLTINTTGGQTVTGLSKALGVGTYKITGSITYVGNQAGGVPTIAFSSGMTVTQGYYNSEYTVRTNNVTATSPITAFNNTGMDALGTAHTGPTLTNGGFVEFTFRATLVVSVAGTLTMQAKTSVAADTFTIQPGGYMCIEPVIAT